MTNIRPEPLVPFCAIVRQSFFIRKIHGPINLMNYIQLQHVLYFWSFDPPKLDQIEKVVLNCRLLQRRLIKVATESIAEVNIPTSETVWPNG